METEKNHTSETLIKGAKEKRDVAFSSVIAAVFLTVIKFIVGIVTGSLGIISEAAHSLFDLFAAVITFFAVRIADRPPDKKHRYGHGKVESISALIETLLLLVTCIWIITEAVERLRSKHVVLDINIWAFVIMIISIIVNISRAKALYRTARKYNSEALEADALHFSSDILSSVVVIIGLAFAYFGYPVADPIAALFVAVIVVYACYELGKKSLEVLLDTAPHGMVEKIEDIVSGVKGIERTGDVRVRRSGSKTFVDLKIAISRKISFEKSHELTTEVEERIVNEFPEADVMIHTDPRVENGEKVIDRIRMTAQDLGLNIHDINIHKISGLLHVGLHMEMDKEMSLKDAHTRATELESKIKERMPEVEQVTTLMDSVSEDEAVGKDLTSEIASTAEYVQNITMKIDGIKDCHDVSIKRVGKGLFVSLHCMMDDNFTLNQVHFVSNTIVEQIKERIPAIENVIVHAEPVTE